MQNETAEYTMIPYEGEGMELPILVRFEEETVRLSQAQIADLYQVAKSTVCYHINNIFMEGELTPEATVREIRIVQVENDRKVIRALNGYNLDMIISIGFRINSKRAVQFRQWAIGHIKNIMLSGYSAQMPHSGLAQQMQQTLEQSQQLIESMGTQLQSSADALQTLAPKAHFCEQVFDVPGCLSITLIAKDLGMTAKALNQLLHELGVQFKQSETWMLYAEWQDRGLADYRTHIDDHHGHSHNRLVWTQLGRAWIICMLEQGLSPREAWQQCQQFTH